MKTYTYRDLVEQCREDMNDNLDVVNIGEYSYLAGDVLESCDPIAFNQEARNYIDGLLRDRVLEYIVREDGTEVYQEVI